MNDCRKFSIIVQNEFKKKKSNVSHIVEDTIMENNLNIKAKSPLPRTIGTKHILNKTNARQFDHTLKETEFFHEQCNQFSSGNPEEIDFGFKKQINKSLIKPKSNESNIKTETKLFIEKKKKERVEKNKLELENKKKIAEERKERLDRLRKTTRELAKASVKKNKACIQDEHKIVENFRKQPEPEVDQTWLPPEKVEKPLKKPLIRNKTFLKSTFNDKIENTLATSPKVLRHTNTVTQTKLFEQKFQERQVTKPENLFSSLNLKQLIDSNIFDESTPKLVDLAKRIEEPCLNSETEQEQKNTIILNKDKSNVSIQSINENDANIVEESCYNSEIEEKQNSVALSEKKSNTSVKPIYDIDTETVILKLQSPNDSLEDILELTDHSDIFQEPSIKSINTHSSSLSRKKCSLVCTKSTQANNYNNLSSLFSSKTSPPPMNFISALMCKSKLQQMKNNKFELLSSLNHITETGNVPNKSDLDSCDKIVRLQHKETQCTQENCSNESVKSESNLFSNKNTENIVCEEITNVVNNDKLNKVTNEDCNDLLHNHNIKSEKNNLIDSSFCFPKIHEELKEVHNTLDQLDSSLYNLEKMSCDMSINTKKHSNDLNTKTLYNNDMASRNSLSKLNSSSSNITSVDKTITEFFMKLTEQLIKDEELRVKQHHTILNLEAKTLINRLMREINLGEILVKNLKNRPGHEKQLQLFEQKYRERIETLEYLLSQVLQRGEIVDSLYKLQLTKLEEFLQSLRTQSIS